ncbi:MAG: hypothetical protein WC390_07070 [Sulfurimonas sp.]|jgi:hypothetical protein
MKYKCKITPENITELKENEIFCFGSNLCGRHGAGAAYTAFSQFNAKYGIGIGFTGQCFALPTKDESLNRLSVLDIKKWVDVLKSEILAMPDNQFLITKIGCGLAGYSVNEIAPLFKDFLQIENCSLPIDFINFLTK